MPIITFNGIKQERVTEYYQKIDEICQLVQASKENVFFITNDNLILNPKKSVYITVEWIQRTDKEQLLTDHIRNFFQQDAEKIGVFFTDVNGKFYLDGEKKG